MTTKTKTVRITYLGMKGEGPTKSDAKKDAMAKIERAMQDDYVPTIIRWRGLYGIVWREPTGYAYTIIREETRANDVGELMPFNYFCGEDYKEALASCKSHLAQNAWRIEDGKEIPSLLFNCPSERQRDFSSWAQWQIAHHHARTVLGMTDSTKLHYWACEHQREF